MSTAVSAAEPGRGLAGVVLAAGEGRRLRPVTEHLPKALVEVGGRALLDGALDRLAAVTGTGPERLAVNAHHHAAQVVARVGGRAHTSLEAPVALGTAGALGRLRPWLAGRDAAVTNADTWMADGPAALRALAAGWDRARCRLLCAPAGDRRPDFTAEDGAPLTYVGSCLLPAAQLARLEPVPAGLYEVLWRDLDARGELDLVVTTAPVVDCGTPGDLARARELAAAAPGSAAPPQPAEPVAVVVMGVSGCGKTTVAERLAQHLGWVFAEADEFHSEANLAKMSAGTPLDDADRLPWLTAIRDWVTATGQQGRSAVVTCSALQRSYRDLLRDAGSRVLFLHLTGPREVLAERMGARTGHFMPTSLLDSQLATLQALEPDEPGAAVSIELSPDEVLRTALERLHLP